MANVRLQADNVGLTALVGESEFEFDKRAASVNRLCREV